MEEKKEQQEIELTNEQKHLFNLEKTLDIAVSKGALKKEEIYNATNSIIFLAKYLKDQSDINKSFKEIKNNEK